ncbi:MAG: site-specific DNA-methyltransferase [Candidatus Latescibacterota bacterium]
MPDAHTFQHGPPNARIVLYREDCLAGMERRLPPESVDVVVTSPPYNLGIRYGRYDDSVPRAEYLDWMESWAAAVSRVLCACGSLFLNIGGKPSDPWGPFEVVARLRRHFRLQNTIHWVKSIAIGADVVGEATGIMRNLAVGHYKPINSRRYLNDCHEYIFHFTRSGDVELDRLAIGVEYQDKSNVSRWAAARGDRRCRGNTWFVPYDTIQNRAKERPHPATFPVRIPLMCIQLHGVGRVRRAMDPFLGIGHSALACRALALPFVGFEIDEHYFAQACRAVSSFEPAASDGPDGGAQLSLL